MQVRCLEKIRRRRRLGGPFLHHAVRRYSRSTLHLKAMPCESFGAYETLWLCSGAGITSALDLIAASCRSAPAHQTNPNPPCGCLRFQDFVRSAHEMTHEFDWISVHPPFRESGLYPLWPSYTPSRKRRTRSSLFTASSSMPTEIRITEQQQVLGRTRSFSCRAGARPISGPFGMLPGRRSVTGSDGHSLDSDGFFVGQVSSSSMMSAAFLIPMITPGGNEGKDVTGFGRISNGLGTACVSVLHCHCHCRASGNMGTPIQVSASAVSFPFQLQLPCQSRHGSSSSCCLL